MPSRNLLFYLPRPSRLTSRIRARLHPLDLEINIVRDVLRCYGLEPSRPPQNIPSGRRSRNITVDTSAGRKVIKRYRNDWQVPAITYSHSILTRLAELAFPAPRLVLTPSGADFVSLSDQYYALSDFVSGTNYEASYVARVHWLKLIARAGETLARFHRQLEGFEPEGFHHLAFKSYTEERHRNMAWYVEQLNSLGEKSQALTGKKDRFYADWLTRNASVLLEKLQQLDEALTKASLPRLVIHGDFGIQNLLFHQDGTLTVMDFELARLDWRLSDLVTSLARFRSAAGSFDFESMRVFVAAYQAEYPISADEWQYLPQVWSFRRIQKAVMFWKSSFEKKDVTHRLSTAYEAIQLAAWATEHKDEILALNTAALQRGK
jgi:Ser/Thr protein kinase RdoA (MazF antagonist)